MKIEDEMKKIIEETERVKARLAEVVKEPVENIRILQEDENSEGITTFVVWIISICESRWLIEDEKGEFIGPFNTEHELRVGWCNS